MQGTAIVRHVVTFGRVLREVGIEVGPGRVEDAVRGLDAVDLTRQDDVYFTLRQTLVSRHDELELFDRAFVAWFLRGPVAPLVRQKQTRRWAERSPATRSSLARTATRETNRHAARARRVRPRAPAREGLRRDDVRGVRALRRPWPRSPEHGRAASRVAARRILAVTCSTCGASAANRCARGASRSSRPGRHARPWRGSSSCSATSPARWTRTRGRSSSTSTRSWERGRASRRLRSARA